VRLTLKTATTADLVAAVLDGALDGAFVAGPIEHADLTATIAFREELVLLSAKRFTNLAALRAGTPESGPTALVFRTGCTYRQRLEQVFSDFGWPSAARFELGTLDGMIGCVAAGMGVTLLPRAVVERSDQRKEINIHSLDTSWSRVDTLFIQRRSAHQYSALSGFTSCLNGVERVIAA
jgi:DNA-binding transcriptional LysR family regulator